MKFLPIASLFILAALSVHSTQLNLIPWPQKIEQQSGQFVLTRQTEVVANPAFTNEASMLADELQLTNIDNAHENRILLTKQGAVGLPDEAYELQVDRQGVIIRANSSAGVFYGCQTLRQLIEPGTQSIPFVKITDAPRYAWRGLMLDVSRHFFGQQTIFQLLDWMADYKLNRLHLHLTDNQAWRLEIKKYPELSQIGAQANHSDSNALPQFFTQSQMRKIIEYAQQLHIVVIPEIEMPGHAGAAILAYQGLDGGTNTFDPANQATYKFLGDVLDDVMKLFPSPWIHLGGDEVNFAGWRHDPDVPEFLKRDNLKNMNELEGYFDLRMENIVLSKGRIPLGWDEIAAHRPLPGTIVYWWRQDKPQLLTQTLANGYSVILSPRSPCYFDYPQDTTYPPIAIGRKLYNTQEAVYEGPVVPTNIPPAQLKQILGVEACIWTEHIPTVPYLEFMTLPRLAALSEMAWTPANERNYAQFNTRLKPFLAQYKQCGIHYYDAADPLGSLHAATNSTYISGSAPIHVASVYEQDTTP